MVEIGGEGVDVRLAFLEMYFAVLIVLFVMGRVIKVQNVLLEMQMEIRETRAGRRVRESAYDL